MNNKNKTTPGTTITIQKPTQTQVNLAGSGLTKESFNSTSITHKNTINKTNKIYPDYHVKTIIKNNNNNNSTEFIKIMDNWTCGLSMGELQKSLSSLKRAGSKNYGILENEEIQVREVHTNPSFRMNFSSKIMPESRNFEQSSFDSNDFHRDSPIKPITENQQFSSSSSSKNYNYNKFHKRSNSTSSYSVDSGFTSPKNNFSRANSLSSSKKSSRTKKLKIPTNFLKSNFQYETKSAVTFENYQNPASLAVHYPNLFVSCKGRQGCINYFQIDFKKSTTDQNNNLLVSKSDTLKINKNPLRIRNSFKIIVDAMPQQPSGMMVNDSGTILYVAINHYIAEIEIEKLNVENLTEIEPRRLIGKELEILHSIIPSAYDHFVVTDVTRGAVSLVDREHGEVVFDYSTHSEVNSKIRNPRHRNVSSEFELKRLTVFRDF